MDFYQNSDSYLRVTEIARQKQGQLEITEDSFATSTS